jgi:hypothetical protein
MSASYNPAGWLGYMILAGSGTGGVPNWNAGGTYPYGQGGHSAIGQNGSGNWVSTSGGYALPNGGATTYSQSEANLGAGTYFFSISVENLGVGQEMITYHLDQVTNNGDGSYYVDLDPSAYEVDGSVLDAGYTASFEDTFSMLGFYVGTSGQANDTWDFQNVEIVDVPEPVSMALVGFGILTGGLFIRRRKS